MNLARGIFGLLLGRRPPITEGKIAVPGLESEITIRRDAWGVPHISAECDVDAWFGQGFCVGQDRAFQLESSLRLVRGTLAEVIGRDGIPADRLSRRIGFFRAANRQVPTLAAETRTAIEAYAGGINAGMTAGMRRKAHEFTLLRITPAPWSAADVLGYLKLISFLLATNWDMELARLRILLEDGADALAALDTGYPEWLPVISPPLVAAGPALYRFAEEAARLMAAAHAGGGSNNWALAPSRTASGQAILANDPHLAPTLPPHWYLAHVGTREWSLAGACFVGLPGVHVGHNGFAAWGLTVGMTDNTDLFLEEIGPDGRSVRQGERFVLCETEVERIAVRGAREIVEDVIVTPRGPIVSPALDGEKFTLSLRATWLDAAPVDGLLSLHRVRGFDDFRRHMEHWPALPLNVAYADTAGTIGWQLIGTAPRRKTGFGSVPLPGWETEVGWEDEPVPYEDMPHLSNPESGFVVSANNKGIRDGDGPFLTVDWLDGFRAARIGESLDASTDWDPAATRRLQMDVQSIPWREMRDVVLASPAPDTDAQKALDLLGDWDGRVTAESPAAAVFEFFVAEMCARVAKAKAPRSWRYVLGEGFHPLVPHSLYNSNRMGHLVRVLREQPEGWFESSWAAEIAGSLSVAVRTLRERRGSNPARWAWGDVRPLTLLHPVGARKSLKRVFDLGPFPWGGDSNTPAQAGVSMLSPTDNPAFIQSLRFVCELGDWENCRWVLPGGQSGNPLSPHYADQLTLWRRGRGIPIAWSSTEVHRATFAVLKLEPLRA